MYSSNGSMLFMKKWKTFVAEYKHGFLALGYLFVYLAWFFYLEQTVTRHYEVIHMAIDDYIPFCEVFIIPYYLWFLYVAATVIYLMFTDKKEYYRACVFLFTGMTVFLAISTLWPNGQHLRPFTMPRDNIFTRMVQGLYRTDTPTNLWPSIHVYNSLGAHIAIMKCQKLSDKKWIQRGSFVLAVSIILSTMFLKQHSAFDVLTAFIMGFVMYGLVYRYDAVSAFQQAIREKKKSEPQLG